MATVTGYTAAHMQDIIDENIVSGYISGDDLILVKNDTTEVNAGDVRGPVGPAATTFYQCTNATQPSWTAGDAGKAIYETDTGLWRIWNGSYFKVQERIICTSTTRPTTLLSTDAGTYMYETDTGLEYFWTGSSFFPAGSYVARFANASARASAWPTPQVGALSYLNDAPGALWIYESGVWNLSGPPAGFYFPTFLDSAPIGHVLMFGQTLSNADTLYPVLWSNTPAAWKSGTSLIVPDMRGRVPTGIDNMGGSDAGRLDVGNVNGPTGVGGSQKHTLTISEMPAHTHAVTIIVAGSVLAGPSGYQATVGNSGSTGGGDPHNNMQPYHLTNWALKVL